MNSSIHPRGHLTVLDATCDFWGFALKSQWSFGPAPLEITCLGLASPEVTGLGLPLCRLLVWACLHGGHWLRPVAVNVPVHTPIEKTERGQDGDERSEVAGSGCGLSLKGTRDQKE